MRIDETSVQDMNRIQLEQAARKVGYEPEADDRDSDLQIVLYMRKAA